MPTDASVTLQYEFFLEVDPHDNLPQGLSLREGAHLIASRQVLGEITRITFRVIPANTPQTVFRHVTSLQKLEKRIEWWGQLTPVIEQLLQNVTVRCIGRIKRIQRLEKRIEWWEQKLAITRNLVQCMTQRFIKQRMRDLRKKMEKTQEKILLYPLSRSARRDTAFTVEKRLERGYVFVPATLADMGIIHRLCSMAQHRRFQMFDTVTEDSNGGDGFYYTFTQPDIFPELS